MLLLHILFQCFATLLCHPPLNITDHLSGLLCYLITQHSEEATFKHTHVQTQAISDINPELDFTQHVPGPEMYKFDILPATVFL